PANKPGIFFVKVPQDWMEHPQFAELMGHAATRFFATRTGRIVSVIIYIEPVTFANGGLGVGHVFAELPNPHHRFGEGDWRLLSRWRPPLDHWNKLPPKWLRLICVAKDGYVGS